MKLLPLALPLALAALLLAASRAPGAAGPAARPQTAGTFPVQWNFGADCGAEPDLQVHAYGDDVWIIRESFCANFEAPFLYLIFGDDKALLLDTGSAPSVDVWPVVRDLITAWVAGGGNPAVELVVAHTHGHGDHIANDAEFVGQPNTTLVQPDLPGVTQFFGFTNWPDQIVQYDLGNRVLDLIPTPGHWTDCLTVYDRRTELLLTGDTIYPGRMYVFGAAASGAWDAYRASIQRLVDFQAQNPISWVVGCHIEMTATPRRDFPYGTTYHPDEHVLQLDPGILVELNTALAPVAQPRLVVLDDLIVHPVF